MADMQRQHLYFYSRPREGGDGNFRTMLSGYLLFLFTPPRRGRPQHYSRRKSKTSNFYSRPREGGDTTTISVHSVLLYFYSRPREGGDEGCQQTFEIDLYISIHAPAKGVTITAYVPMKRGYVFLFTPPRRGRQNTGWSVTSNSYFYSRPREGGDMSDHWIRTDTKLFLFTPPRRGRQHTFIIFISICVQLLSIMHNAISLLFIFRT